MSGFFSQNDAAAGEKKVFSKLARCGQCGNLKNCISPKLEVQGEGKQRILFVNDTPGKYGARTGKHFAGDLGGKFRDMLLEAGGDIDECLQTSAVICGRSDNKSIEPFMVSACRPFLYKAIEKYKPHVIVPVGHDALTSVLSEDYGKSLGPMEKWVGWTIPSETFGAWVAPVYSPNRIYQMKEDQVCVDEYVGHLRQALAVSKKKPKIITKSDLESKVDIITSPRLAYKKLKWLSQQEGILAFDYETTGLKPERSKQKLVSVSFCLNGVDTFACMLYHPKVVKALKAVLTNPKLKMVASNLKFEEKWTRAKLGYGIANWHWDTMLVAHLLDNRSSITSVKFQAFVHLGIGDYNSHIEPYLKSSGSNTLNRVEELDPRDLLLYNGMDSLLEYMVMKKQKELYIKR